MLIRSQDKKELHNLDRISMIRILPTIESEYVVEVNSQRVIGVYSTEEKAIKVLDMIQDAYEEANSVCTMSGFVANTVFQMPQDSEV